MPNAVQVGSHLKIAIDGEERDFVIVESSTIATQHDAEVISVGSQMGKALLGKKEGDAVEIVIEGVPKLYRIVSIQA